MRTRLGRWYPIAAILGAAAAVGCVAGVGDDYDSLRTTEQEVTATSRVLVNQIGYVSNLTKIASVTGSGCNGKAFYVKNGTTTVFTGTTGAAVTDPGSGELVCKANFSSFTSTGTFTLQVDGISTSDPFLIASSGANLYPQSLYENAVYYFTYHRLGTQNVSISLPGSTGTTKSRSWTARSNVSLSAYNGWTSGSFNIDGGHMDGGDLGLYADSAAHAMWSLMNLVELKNPNSSLSKLPDGTKDLISEIIYGTKFMNGLLPADTSRLAAHKCHDVSWSTQPWGYTGGDETNRRCMGPSSTATYAVARSLAQLVRIAGTRLGTNETTYWNRAKEAWSRVQGKDGQVFDPNNTAHSPGFAEGGGPYNDANALDDRFAAAVELYLTQKARGESLTSAYLSTINSTATNCQSARCLGKVSRRFMDWEHDYTQGNLSLMAYHLKAGGTCTSTSCSGGISADIPSLHLVRNGIIAEADNTLSTIATNGFPTPIAGSDYPWGSNKVVAHAAMILGYAHHLSGNNSYLSGMHQSFDYLLGQNTLRFSFITGYGTRFERATHDRQSNGNTPIGWLAGGPLNAAEVNDPVTPMHANPAKNYAMNEADFGQAWCSRENTVDWNGPLSWVAWYIRNPSGTGGSSGPTIGTYYSVKYRHSGKCLDVAGVSTNSGANVQQYSCSGGSNQKLKLEDRGSGWYALVFQHSGQCVDVYGAGTSNGATVIQWPCHYNDNQLFQLVDHNNGYYSFKYKHSNRCVDVYGASSSDGADVIQWDCHYNNNQQFEFVQ